MRICLRLLEQRPLQWTGPHCGHLNVDAVSIPCPAPGASGIGSSTTAVTDQYFIGVEIKHQTCNGDCSYQSLIFDRVYQPKRDEISGGRAASSCKTAFRPYDLAVQCLLLIGKHHLEDHYFGCLVVWHRLSLE